MRKILAVLLLGLLLCPPASAAEMPKFLALTFEEVAQEEADTLLDALDRYDARATFLLTADQLEENPELARILLARGHELGLRGIQAESLSGMSRRAIAGELTRVRDLLPESARPRFARLGFNSSPAQVRQVARVTGLALLGWSGDFRDPDAREASAAGQSALARVRDGDVLVMDALSEAALAAALNTLDNLRRQGFRFVTVSELARFRGQRIEAGEYYRSFPPKEP